MWRWTKAAAVAAALAVTGCERTLIPASLVKPVKDMFATQMGGQLASVSCPDGMAPKPGTTFECATRTDRGEDVTVQVVVTDESGNVDLKSKGVVSTEKVRQLIGQLGRNTWQVALEVDCGSAPYRLVKPGESFACQAKDPSSGQAVGFNVLVKDEWGTVSVESKAPEAPQAP